MGRLYVWVSELFMVVARDGIHGSQHGAASTQHMVVSLDDVGEVALQIIGDIAMRTLSAVDHVVIHDSIIGCVIRLGVTRHRWLEASAAVGDG